MVVIYIGAFLLLILDQVVKYWTITQIALHDNVTIINGIFSLTYVKNDGAAWGILSGNMVFFYVITIAIVLVLAYWIHTKKIRLLEKVAYMFVIAGALGNFIDRIRLNYVIDMFKLDFINFPIFNVADICLTIGVIVFLVDVLLSEILVKEGKNGRN